MIDCEKWLLQAKSGKNPEAYRLWAECISPTVAVTAFQNGVQRSETGEFQAKVFGALYLKLPELDSSQVETELYRISANTLPEFISSEKVTSIDEMFHFEEDAILHETLQQLDHAHRIAFNFFHFHGKSLDNLVQILSVDPAELHSMLRKSEEFILLQLGLEDVKLEKRLELLAKSYSRLELPLPEKKELTESGPAPITQEIRKAKTGKNTIATLAAATLVLATLFIVSFVLDSPETARTADVAETAETHAEKVEQWREQYSDIKNSSPQRLGISPEAYEELSYVSEADHLITRILSEENLEKMKDDSLALEEQFTRVLFHIQTPQGMVDLLDENPLSSEETDHFIYTFANKTEELMMLTNNALEKHNAEFEDAIVDGEPSVASLLSDKNGYSEAASNLLEGIDEQMLTVIPHPTEDRFITRRDLNPLYEVSSIMNDWTVSSNLMLLASEPFYDGTGLLIPLEEAAYRLKELEHYLLDEHSRSMLYTDFTDKFQQLFWLVLKGSERNPVFSEADTVTEEYKSAWNLLAESRENPILSVMLPILDEMEETEWRFSEHYNDLSQMQITHAMQMEMVGYLSEEMPNGHMATEPVFIDMEGFSYDDSKDLYDQFKKNYDKAVLSGLPPSEVYFLYQYANRMKDPETMWHLLNEEDGKPDKQDFLMRWQQLPDIAETARWLEYAEESFHRQGRNLVVQINIHYSDLVYAFQDGPRLVTSENDVWLVDYQFSESYTREQMEKGFKEKVHSLYDGGEWENATPAEIFGVVLLAKDQSDYKTLERLTDEFHQTHFNSDFEELIKNLELPSLEDIVDLAFIGEPYDETVENEMGRVYMNRPSEPFSHVFSMIKTPDGWKLAY